MLLSLRRHSRGGLIVALDIGSRQTKVVAASPASGPVTVRAAEAAATPPGSAEGLALSEPAPVASLVREIAESVGAVGCPGLSVIGGRQVILRWVTTPPLAREDALDAVRVEGAKLLPMPPHEAAMDVQLLPGGDADSDGRWSRGMVIAAPKSLAEKHAECMELAGLEPAGLDVIQLALLRALNGTSSANMWESHPWAIVALGASATELLVADGDTLAFCRTIAWGTDRLTAAFEKGDHDTATAATDDLTISREGQVEQDGRALPEEVQRAAGLATLAAEIKRSLIYYQMQFPEGSYRGVVGRIVLTGGGALIPGMHAYLQGQLETAVQVGDPFRDLDARIESQAFGVLNAQPTAFAPCLGLIVGAGDSDDTYSCDEQTR
jgi:type IV pilus assembly protein PilM